MSKLLLNLTKKNCKFSLEFTLRKKKGLSKLFPNFFVEKWQIFIRNKNTGACSRLFFFFFFVQSQETFVWIPCETIKKNLNFPYNAKHVPNGLFGKIQHDSSVFTMGKIEYKRLKYWFHNWTLGELNSLMFCEFNFNLSEVFHSSCLINRKKLV